MSKKRSPVPQMKGVSAFLSTSLIQNSDSNSRIAIHKICLPKKQPRKYFDPDKLQQLIASVEEHGILEPLLVRPIESGLYELVAGERRYKAAKVLNLEEVPVVIQEMSEQHALQIALVENLQREDLNPVEETEAVLDLLMIELNCDVITITETLAQMATANKKGTELSGNVSRQLEIIEKVLISTIGITPESFRTSRLPLLKLPADVLDTLRKGQLEYTKARTIARVKDIQRRQELLEKTLKESLSIAEIRKRVKIASQREPELPSISNRLSILSQKLKRKQIKAPDRQKRLEELLQELENLVQG